LYACTFSSNSSPRIAVANVYSVDTYVYMLQEWITPQPSRRPDPVPDFEKLDTPKIRPLPGDPEQPDEEEEEEEEKKKKEKEDPDKDKPDPSQDPPE